MTAATKPDHTSSALVLTQDLTPDERVFQLAQREAKALSLSDLVPKEYRENIPNCLIAINLAKRLNADPLMIMQSMDIIHGRPSWRSTFLIACINDCGRYTALRYEISGEGQERGCIAWAIERETGDRIEGPRVTMAMAKAEGWSTKSGSKWVTMPELMLRYRAAAFFARTNCPELTMGLHTADELEDMHGRAPARAERPSATAAREALTAAVDGAKDVTPEGGPPAEDLCPHGKIAFAEECAACESDVQQSLPTE